MKILFTGLYPMWHYHYVAELNYLQQAIDEGNEVTLLTCEAWQECCEANKQRALPHCLRCMGIQQHGDELLLGKVRRLPLIRPEHRRVVPVWLNDALKDVESLKGIEVDGFDLGYAVYSSLVDRVKEKYPDLARHREVTRRLIVDAYRIHLSARAHLLEGLFDCVYVFNGRYAGARPWLRACKEMRVPFYTHERTTSLCRAIRIENRMPHNPDSYLPMILSAWEQFQNDPLALEEGHQFFRERPQGVITGWDESFVKNQKSGSLPEGWEPDRRNIVFFTSSDSEFWGIQDSWSGGKSLDQKKAVLELARKLFALRPETRLYLRIHPNSKHEVLRWWDNIETLATPNLTLIPPESDISTYDLLWNAWACVAYFSTVGIEATYWGKPSLILQKAFYSGLDAVYEPTGIEEALHILCQESLNPKPQINALKYGVFIRRGGDPLPYSAAVNNYTMTFHGEILEARREVHEWLGRYEARLSEMGALGYWEEIKQQCMFWKLRWLHRGRLSARHTRLIVRQSGSAA